MHKVPKDIDLIVYRFINRDLIKQLNSEYHEKLKVCNCKEDSQCKNGVCTGFIKVILVKNCSIYQDWDYKNTFNHRQLIEYRNIYNVVYDKYNNSCSALPKNY